MTFKIQTKLFLKSTDPNKPDLYILISTQTKQKFSNILSNTEQILNSQV